MLTSQPFAAAPSQFAKPALQVIVHWLPLQEALALVVPQTLPQLPQFWMVRRSASQPLVVLLSQFAKFWLQVMPLHKPPVQNGVPPTLLQTVVQLPQWFTSLLMFVSQPLPILLSQLPQPGLHVMLHVLAEQVAVPLVEPQTVVHVPQWLASDVRFVSQPFVRLLSQLPKPLEQLMPHTPAVQDAVPLVVLQTFVQLPQRVGVVFRFVSQPLETLPSQLPKPVLHVIPHAPLVHEAVPFVELHALLQLPQRATLVFRLISQPFAALRSQLANPELQVMAQVPLLQVAVPLAEPH